jgi:hypothetical protein
MKWFSFLLLAVLAFFSNACEMHPASELETENGHSANPRDAHAETQEAEQKHEEKKAEEGKPGEAPKFFPETK